MVLTKEEAQSVIWDDTDEWENIESNIIDTSRWSNIYVGIFKHLATEKYYSVDWSEAATESQDEEPFGYQDEVKFTEVHQVEEITKAWRTV